MNGPTCRPGGASRPGFTILETMIGLGLLTVALVMLAQAAVWLLGDKLRLAGRQEALEAAANVLESARASSWDDLTPEWAAAQQLPEAQRLALAEGKLTVRVEPEAGQPRTRRVTVEVDWTQSDGKPAPTVGLIGLFSSRTTAAGGKP
jgi:type II secretory pathway pseudopilin PulG